MITKEEMDARSIRQYQAHTTRQTMSDMKIIYIGHNLADVFLGEGWLLRGRYRLIKGKWIHVVGAKLTERMEAMIGTTYGRTSHH